MEGTTEPLGKNHVNTPEPSQSIKKEVYAVCKRMATDSVMELLDAYLNLSSAMLLVEGGRESKGGGEL